MKSLKDFMASQLAVGKSFFAKEDALRVLGITPEQFKYQAFRLRQKRLLKRLYHDFYMIVPPEYYNWGAMPPLMFIDHLMKYLNQDYYVGLLSAASLYGATHQQPMVFQVITTRIMKKIKLERGSVEFHVYSGCKTALKNSVPVQTGYVQVSSKEQTMIDLMRFYKASGYLDNVALVIKDLAKECDPHELTKVIKKEKETPLLQRLGYILRFTGFSDLANIVAKVLKKRKLRYVLLKPEFHRKKGKKLEAWQLIVNNTLELE